MDKSILELTIDGLAFERNDQPLFNYVSSEIRSGELLQVGGANGSGKSTLLRILAGFLQPLNGSVLWNGKSITKHRDSYQQQLHYVGHQNGIKPYLSVSENLKLTGVLLAARLSSSQIKNILETINLHTLLDRPALHLSAGQLRRLSLAKLLLKPATLWILDEPATALDLAGQQLLTRLLQQHLLSGGMAILATHQLLSITGNIKNIQLGGQNA